MPKKVLFIMFAGLFLLGSLNSVLAAPPRKGSRRKEAQPQPQIDQDIGIGQALSRPEQLTQATLDEPIIHEFSANPLVIAAGEMLRLRWRVEAQPSGSRIRTVRIEPDVTAYLRSSGEHFVHIPHASPTQTKRYILTVTNEAGGTASRTVDVEIKSQHDLFRVTHIDEFKTEPQRFQSGQYINFTVKVNNRSGVPYRIRALKIQVRDYYGEANIATLDNPLINPGINTYTLRSNVAFPGSVRNPGRFLVDFKHTGEHSGKIVDFEIRRIEVYTIE